MLLLSNASRTAVVAALVCVFAASSHAADPPPNVLFIAIDDLNDWVEPLQGHPLVKTPHLNRLAARGVNFTNAHCQTPLCNSSRTSVMLGLRPTTTGIYGLSPWFRDVPEFANRLSMPVNFRQNGYRTYSVGKVYHGGGYHRSQEFDEVGSLDGNARPEERLIPQTPGGHRAMDWGVFPHQDEDKRDYQVASWVADKLAAMPRDQPFFLAAGFSLPHVPLYATQQWFDLYPDDESILPPVREDERSSTPRFSWYLHWELPEPRLEWVQENDQWVNLVRSYLACTSFIDAQVGRIFAALEASGMAENTIVVLWSDHGYHLGEKEITGKNTLWERSARVPMILAGPGIAQNGNCHQPVELLDLYPTLIDLCGLTPIDDLEGQSLGSQLRDPDAPRQAPAITTHNQGNHAVRSLEWRYIVYADGSEELYNLKRDPDEFENLAGDPKFSSIVEQHRNWLPKVDRPPAPNSASRILTYDSETDVAVWEGKEVRRQDPIPD